MKRRGFVKWSYLSILVSMLIWTVRTVTGGIVFTEADGMVVGEPGSISPEYTVTVLEIPVHNGDKVKKGDIVARVSSSRVGTTTATLSMQSSQLVTRMAEITAKSQIIDQLINSADTRDKIVKVSNDSLQQIKTHGYLPLLTANALADQVYKGQFELATLKAEKETINQQVAQIVAASRFTDQAITDIQVLFDAGRMKAPMDGYIAGIDAAIGSVIREGDLVAEMVGEERYVLAYYPLDRLFNMHIGDAVTIVVSLGNRIHGSITRIEPIAARLPKEFQRTLSPVERQQLVRIDFDKNVEPPPYFTKVVVR